MHRTGSWRAAAAAALVLATLLPQGSGRAGESSKLASGGGKVRIQVLSNRADLISGGDAYVEILLPKNADPNRLRVKLGKQNVSDAFSVRADGRILGIVDGLKLGRNLLRAESPGRGAKIAITNYPIGGPVFSGPQSQPWACAEGALDEQCNRPPVYTFMYKPAVPFDCLWLLGNINGCDFRAYNPENPPPPQAIAQTTTDQGVTVPYIVRVESGTINRDQYKIAVLFDPDEPWAPWAPQESWNHKLVIRGGSGCGFGYAEEESADVLQDTSLSRGFAVMSHSLAHAGHNCNPVTQAESLMMTKEHLVEGYGEIRYTIGSGCSGGSHLQYGVANAYPGIYQGITVACSFPDPLTGRTLQMLDDALAFRYFNDPALWRTGVVWTPPGRAAVVGRTTGLHSYTLLAMGPPDQYDPSSGCPGVPSSDVYDPETNPTGVRCTFQDYMISVYGRRSEDLWGPVEEKIGRGFANRPVDNVGVQYGLNALLAGKITPAQFVDLNAKIGSYDIDLNWQPARVAADPPSLPTAYRAGPITTGSNLDQVAIIDVRGPEEPGVAGHDAHRTYVVWARLEREHGHADNQILWRGPVPLVGGLRLENEAILAMDEWLAAVEADTRGVPLPRKIVEDKPETVTHRCTDGAGQEAPAALCDAVIHVNTTPRTVAGMPFTEDVLKCQLKPLRRSDYYPILFTDDEWSTLEKTFPTGVCDYSKPGVGYQKTFRQGATFADGPGGEPLGPPPQSKPIR